MVTEKKLVLLLILFLCAIPASQGGGGPQNVLVVVNDQSIESQELGTYYAEQRGIPARNICHISVAPTIYRVDPGVFQTSVVDRIHAQISAQGLSNQIDYVVLCKDIPYAVRWYGDNNIQNGSSAIVFYGFKEYTSPYGQIHPGTTNGYYMTERSFRHADAYMGTNYYATMLLTAYNLVQGKTMVDRAITADAGSPTGTYYFCKSTDAYRNLRYKFFDDLDFAARFFDAFPAYEFIENPWSGFYGKSVLGYLQGVTSVPWIFDNTYVAGAMCDHLTSSGGSLFDVSGQMSILDWIKAGAAASYGTVAEPYTIAEKFPHPLAWFWQARGFNNAESYWMSVRNPYQGVFVGDPLAAPYAKPPSVFVTNLLSNQVVSGVVTVDVVATTNAFGAACQSIDIYVDDLFGATITNAPPAPGNLLKVSVNSATCSYTVVTGDTLVSAVSNLAARVNSSNIIVRAQAFGDRLQLVYTNYGYEGTAVTYGISCEQGTAGVQRVFGQALSSNLIESTYIAREYLLLRGTATAGDWVRAIITLTNGVAITNRVNAAGGESAQSVMTKLKDMINTNAVLSAANGVKATNYVPYSGAAEFSLDARFAGPAGYRLRVAFTVSGPGFTSSDSFTDYFNDNVDVLTAHGNILFRCGQEPLNARYLWNSADAANGLHTLRAVAHDGTAVEVQGHYLLPVVVSNSALACSIAAPSNGEQVVLGSNLLVQASATNGSGSITQFVIYVEGKAAAVSTNGQFALVTTNYGVGPVNISADAYDAAGARAVAAPTTLNILMSPTLDTDGDGMADAWEQAKFGGLYVYDGDDDPDADGWNNYYEFVTDTSPTNAGGGFQVSFAVSTNGEPGITLVTSTARVYMAQYNDSFTNNYYAWTAAATNFQGTGAAETWVDDGTETSPHPSNVMQRVYRMQVSVP